jgi:hypothetical protein
MHRIVLLSAVVLGFVPPPSAAAQTSKRSDLAGRWIGRAIVNDTAVTTLVLVATADSAGWTLTFPGGNPIPTRVIAIGGDTIVTVSGPYPSMRRVGQTVVTRIVGHLRGDSLTGTFEATYSVAGVTRGRIEATRKR